MKVKNKICRALMMLIFMCVSGTTFMSHESSLHTQHDIESVKVKTSYHLAKQKKAV